jgi:hypothetical protein
MRWIADLRASWSEGPLRAHSTYLLPHGAYLVSGNQQISLRPPALGANIKQRRVRLVVKNVFFKLTA